MNLEQRREYVAYLYEAHGALHKAYAIADKEADYSRMTWAGSIIDKLEAALHIETITKVET
jgi:hypothetical protein